MSQQNRNEEFYSWKLALDFDDGLKGVAKFTCGTFSSDRRSRFPWYNTNYMYLYFDFE